MPGKLKVDFHTHTADDPKDYINFTAEQLIDRAGQLGYDALAITNHDVITFSRAGQLGYDALAITNHDVITFSRGLEEFAGKRGVLLIPGAELTLSDRHVVVISPEPWDVSGIRTLDDLEKMRGERALVIAPHPFYPGRQCLRSKLAEYIDSFDAVEFSFFYNHLINRNKRAVETAREHRKPLVGSCDCHNIWQIGYTYTMVEAEKDIASIIEAVKQGKVEVVTRAVSLLTMARVAVNWALGDRLRVHLRV